ncbi:MAG: tautomerase family protein [Gallionella sp.]|nr:tautomerase family protein [Gallionella sp.]
MPILNVKICGNPSAELSARVAVAMTGLTVEILKKKRELTAVAVEYISSSQWFIAAEALASQSVGTFYLDIKVTEGTNTKDEKALFVKRVFAAMEEMLGPLAQASYIVVHEVRGDAWGYQGQSQEYRYIQGKVL